MLVHGGGGRREVSEFGGFSGPLEPRAVMVRLKKPETANFCREIREDTKIFPRIWARFDDGNSLWSVEEEGGGGAGRGRHGLSKGTYFVIDF